MIAVAGTLLIGGGAYLSYLKAQPKEQFSDLTLANLEAMAMLPGELDVDGDIYTDNASGRDDCSAKTGGTCGQLIVTPSGSHMEYLVGAKYQPI